MDERQSVYLDTISIASDSQPINRKSLSLSRQTIYHSAESLPYQLDTHIDGRLSAGHRYGNGASYPSAQESAELQALSGRGGIGDQREHLDESWRRFADGEKSVDFVLSYRANDDNEQNTIKRQIFESNLEKEGLILEREQTQRIYFVKIHAPLEVLQRNCEILKIKMPMKKLGGQDRVIEPELQLMQEVKSFFGKPFQFVKLNQNLFPDKKYEMMFEYSRSQRYLFDDNDPSFFTDSVRITVVHFILERQEFSESEKDEPSCDVGIDKLINDGVYHSAYPLHDGDWNVAGSQRALLFSEWGSIKKWIKHQPLDNIKDYFGAQIALYFAWLGFYTHMLIPASVVGLIIFFYGLITLFSNKISEDICNDNRTIIMCPQCDGKCDYWYLSDTCLYSRIGHLFDNNLTVVFAAFMSFWAVLYLELWKRYSAKWLHKWGLTEYCHKVEHPRPQYLARLKSSEELRFNAVRGVLEPHVPFWKVKFPMYFISFSAVFLFICLAIAAVFGIIIYRMSLNTSRNIYGDSGTMAYKIMVLPATAAVINLVVITILNYVYDYLAVFLTEKEYRRTQTEYDESLTLKIYLFQFINYYSSIFYIAFMKGKFVGYPAKYNRIFNLRQEECGPGGCLMELCIQLVIIMVGKQAINSVLEMLLPFIYKTINSVRITVGLETDENGENLICCNKWTEDFKLLAWGSRGLFDEYLEMIIQYGFITIFVVAFPLGPLFALINNIFEMRLDAKKFLKYYRRPVPKRVKDIGVWFNIMNILGRIAVAASAFIIAFSSNFIPRLVYSIVVNPEHNDIGFLNHTLAYFHTSDFQNGTAPYNSSLPDLEICRYNEYRNPPWHENKYKRPLIYWHILAARLAFIVVFQNVVSLVQMIVAWAIPDVPRKLRDQIKREDHLIREHIISQEKEIAASAGWIPLLRKVQNQPTTMSNGGNEEDVNLRHRPPNHTTVL